MFHAFVIALKKILPEPLYMFLKQLWRPWRDFLLKRQYQYYKSLSPDEYPEALKKWYKKRTGKTLNLENPQTFNEKIQWLKLYDSTPLKTRLADKYLVRDWVKEKIGEEYLIPLLGVYDKFDDIDFDKLPDKFVMKANHGSGWNIIVQDKSKLNIADAKKKFDFWMSHNYAFNSGLELHYLNMTPRIIIEEYLENTKGNLYDYKLMCFGGEVKFIWIDTDRFTDHRRTLFTTEWNRMEERINYPPADHEILKPKNLDKMLKFASILSKDFAHVRVDFYEVNEKLYFGETTFTSESGTARISSEKFDVEMGRWIKLPAQRVIGARYD